MWKTKKQSRFHSNRPKQKPKIEISTSLLSPKILSFKQDVLSGNGFIVYKWALKISN